MSVSWSRPESFGAWVRLDDATLVAVNHALAARLGVASGTDVGGSSASPTGPLEVHVAVTSRCPAGCEGCYLDARPDGEHPDTEALRARLDAVRRAGASTVAFGGGEPLTRRDLGELAAYARSIGLVPVMTTSGLGLTEERARELRAFAQVNVSHDGVGGAFERVRGYDGASGAERAIARLHAAGVKVGVNLVLTRGSVGSLEATAERVRDLGAGELQLLRYKPAGRAAGLDYFARRLGPDDVAGLWPAIERLCRAGLLRVRIDCAMVPLLSESLARVPDAARRLAELGVFGCEAAHHLGGVTVKGAAAPCSFAGSVDEDERGAFDAQWRAATELEAFRAYHARLPAPCADCELRSVCRGGCQVVSHHAKGGFAPDPECPRVAAHRAHEAASAVTP